MAQYISKVNVGGTVYEIALPYSNGGTLENKGWADILNLVNDSKKAHFIVCTEAANTPEDITFGSVTGTLVASENTKGMIYLVPHTHTQGPRTNDTYDEYITAGTTSLTWEKIGSTDIDLSAYSKKGSFTKAPTTGSTGYNTKLEITTEKVELTQQQVVHLLHILNLRLLLVHKVVILQLQIQVKHLIVILLQELKVV